MQQLPSISGSIDVKVKTLSPLIGRDIPLPWAATSGSAGVDLSACVDQSITLLPGERKLIPTGIAIELPGPYVGAFIFARSGLASRSGIHLANGVGVVDSDYRGEIMVALVNGGADPFTIAPGDRIAQMVFLPVFAAKWTMVDDLEDTSRGAGGFGHTGMDHDTPNI